VAPIISLGCDSLHPHHRLNYRDFHRDSLRILGFWPEGDPGYRLPLRCHPNVAVPLQHGPAHVAHESQHGGLRYTRFGQSCGEGMREVMQPAGDARILPECLPGMFDIGYGAGWIGGKGRSPGEQETLRLRVAETLLEPDPMRPEDGRQIVIDRDDAPGSAGGLARPTLRVFPIKSTCAQVSENPSPARMPVSNSARPTSRLSSSVSGFDLTHSFVGRVRYELPLGKDNPVKRLNRILQLVERNWELNGIPSLRSGLPYVAGISQCIHGAQPGRGTNACRFPI
jgi:hypothetical protein